MTFTCLERHFEWLIISFSLKITPQVFKRKMDNIFRGVVKFTCTYIDDILIFSKTKAEHRTYLNIIFIYLKNMD